MVEWIAKYWIECAFGLILALLGALWKHLTNKFRQAKAEQDAIRTGLQALLRAQMINDFQHYSDKGSAPIYAREAFENCYQQYKALGGNGVMKDVHEKFINLPIE